MDILNIIISIALCTTLAIDPAPRPSENPLTGTPQARQTSTSGTAVQRSTTPNAAPTGQTTGTNAEQDTPASELPTIHHGTTAGATAGSPAAPFAPLGSSPTLNTAIGPQDGTCAPTSGTWGTPANDAAVNNVPDRDPGTVQWDIDSQCTLTIHHGTSPNYGDPFNFKYKFPWDAYRSTITTIHIDGNLTLHTTYRPFYSGFGAFRDMPELSEVRIDGTLHLSQKAAASLFGGDSALTAFTGTNPAGFETSQTTDMLGMFDGCSSLTKLDLSSFNTTNTTDMHGMFDGCSSLTKLDLSSFNTTNTTDLSDMFQYCSSLTKLDLSNFNTTNTTNMSYMFYHCKALTALDVTHFDTTNTSRMNRMFAVCKSLTALDLSSFNTTNTTNMGYMFNSCSRLRVLWLGPNTYLAKDSIDLSVVLFPDSGWVELTAPGGPTPVPSMVARTAIDSGRSPEGHYVRTTLTVTVDYNNGQPDHAKTLTDTAGTQRIDWGTQPAPAGKAFDGWAFTTSDPEHVTLDGNTVTWTDLGTDVTTGASTATITAKWRDLGTPAIAVNIHADGTPNPDGTPGPWAEITATLPKGAAAGDGIRLESANGTGRTADCTPAAGTGTCTFNLTIAQLRDASDYEAPYRLKASVSAKDTRTDPAGTAYGTPADKQGILPYTTVNHHTGTGTGTPPATARALTDTDTRTAQLTVAGPSPIKRPEHSLFATWHSGNGTDVHAGTTPVPTSLGDTDTQGRTTIDLTAQWTPLTAPAGLNATRDPADNSVTISGTATPHSNTDTIRICHTAPGGGTQCHDTTTDTTDQHGNTLPYNGTTEHPWHITLPASTPDGDWSVDTTLTTKDTAYPTGNQQVDSPTTHTNIHIPTPYTGTLPLTGGNNRSVLLTLAGTLAAAMLLLAAANPLRNRRSRACHTARPAQGAGQWRTGTQPAQQV